MSTMKQAKELFQTTGNCVAIEDSLYAFTEDLLTHVEVNTETNVVFINNLRVDLGKCGLFKPESVIKLVALSKVNIVLAIDHPEGCYFIFFIYNDKFIYEGGLIPVPSDIVDVTKVKLSPQYMLLGFIGLDNYKKQHVYCTSLDANSTLYESIEPKDVVNVGYDILFLNDGTLITLYIDTNIVHIFSITPTGEVDIKTTQTLSSEYLLKQVEDTVLLNDVPVCLYADKTLIPVESTYTETAPVIPNKADTKQLPEMKSPLSIDKTNMIIRHHLVIQQLLSAVTTAIKENKPVNISIKSLELTEERVKITGLEIKQC